MPLLDEVKKLTRGDIAFAIGVFVSIVAPGFLTLYLYKPSLVGSLETIKLLIFSAALTLPFVVVNHFVASQIDGFKDHHVAVGISMVMSCVVLYGALLISYFASLPFRWHLLALIAIQTLLVALVVYLEMHETKKA